MLADLKPLLRTLRRWQTEHASVADSASAANFERLRWLTPLVALLETLVTLILGGRLLTSTQGGVVRDWHIGLLLANLGLGLTMLTCALALHHLRHASRSRWGFWLPLGGAGAGLLWAVALVAVDQWVTPNITPFLLSCLLTGAVLLLQPLPAAVLYGVTYISFHLALGWTQGNPEQLFSNRLNGSAACLLGWALSTLLWRNFTIITLQQRQLLDANSALLQRQRELERLTRNDGLTGLFNRNTFVQLTEQELARAQRQGNATALLLLDLDFFKRINDSLGHPAGDAVLRHVATLLSQTVRSTDLVGRLGGEEFIVLLPGTSISAARKLAEKLRQTVAAQPTDWPSAAAITVTVSIGVSGHGAAQASSFDELYSQADAALYEAKKRGRNRVV